MKLSIYNSIVLTPLGDFDIYNNEEYTYQSLCSSEEGRECHISSLQFGYEFVVAYTWLKYKLNTHSADMEAVLKHLADEDCGTLGSMLKKRYLQDLVITPEAKHPYVIGSNIVIPYSPSKVNVKYLLRALYMLTDPNDKLISFLNYVCRKSGGQVGSINRIVFTSKEELHKNQHSNLAELISLIDFSIPSIYVLLKMLGYNYFNCNPYLDKDNSFGKPQAIIGGLPEVGALSHLVRLYYSDTNKPEQFSLFKFIPKELLVSMILDNSAFQPMTYETAQAYGIITNHLIG